MTDARTVLPATLPRQHGAWSVLLSGFALGVVVSGPVKSATVLMLGSVVLGFVACHAAGVAARLPTADGRRPRILGWAAAYGAASILLAAALALWHGQWLVIPIGAAAVALGAFSLSMRVRRGEGTLGGELVGMLGLSLAVPAAAYAGTGAFEPWMAGLWALSSLFFMGTVFHVRHVVRKRRERAGPLSARLRAGAPLAVYHAAALAAACALTGLGLLPPWGFAPLLPPMALAVLAILRPNRGRVVIGRVGYGQVLNTLVFVALSVITFRAQFAGQ